METKKYLPVNTPFGKEAIPRDSFIGIRFSFGQMYFNNATCNFLKISHCDKICFEQVVSSEDIWIISTDDNGFPLKQNGNSLSLCRANLVAPILKSKGFNYKMIRNVRFEVASEIIEGKQFNVLKNSYHDLDGIPGKDCRL